MLLAGKTFAEDVPVETQRRDGSYLIAHLGTGVNVKAHVVVGQLGGLSLQLPGENDLPAAGNTHTDIPISTKGNTFSLVLLLLTVMAPFCSIRTCCTAAPV